METIIEAKNVSVKYITGDLRNIGLKEFVMKKFKVFLYFYNITISIC